MYTKRSKAQIDALVDGGDYASLTTTCTSDITDMGSLFYNAHTFNQDIDSWDVSSVTDMSSMLYQVHDFTQDLSGWCVSNITTKPSDFDYGTNSWVLPRPVWGTCPS